jgi:hypothetical protein
MDEDLGDRLEAGAPKLLVRPVVDPRRSDGAGEGRFRAGLEAAERGWIVAGARAGRTGMGTAGLPLRAVWGWVVLGIGDK